MGGAFSWKSVRTRVFPRRPPSGFGDAVSVFHLRDPGRVLHPFRGDPGVNSLWFIDETTLSG